MNPPAPNTSTLRPRNSVIQHSIHGFGASSRIDVTRLTAVSSYTKAHDAVRPFDQVRYPRSRTQLHDPNSDASSLASRRTTSRCEYRVSTNSRAALPSLARNAGSAINVAIASASEDAETSAR